MTHRGKETATGQWVYGSLVEINSDGSFPHTSIVSHQLVKGEPQWSAVDKKTVTAWTGLWDGSTPPKQVFDGDILRSDEYPYNSDGKDNYYGVVFWDDETARFGIETVRSATATVRGASDGNCSSLENITDFQVIGNVFENINLLRERYKF